MGDYNLKCGNIYTNKISYIRVVAVLAKRSKSRARDLLQFSAHECTVWTFVYS